MSSLIVENSLVTKNDIAHDVAPHRLLEIALASVVNNSPVRTHGIGLLRTDERYKFRFAVYTVCLDTEYGEHIPKT